jgi:DNA helicase-2/ATP-dependent DNA helicase PcrA
VDEFQDTNSIQYKWLRALKGDYASIFAVGDDDQAIYSFRGSNVEIMREFVDEIGEENVVRLEQNYRSTGAILQAANSLIDKNEARLGKNLWTDSGDGNRVRVLGFNNDLDESDYVARSIKKLLDAGTDPEEIAILYRSNHQSRGYETSLMAYGIPYMIHGGTKFYDRMEVRNALAYMRLTSNEVDDSAFDRIINFPPRGLGEKTLEQIQQRARSERASTGASMSLLEASSCIEASPKVVGALGDFVEVLIDLHNAMTTLNLPQYVNYLIERTGLVEFYESKKEEGERQRANNLKELVTAAARFCEESDIPDALSKPADEILAEFMAAATLDSAVDKKKAGEAEGEGQKPKAIKLMTVHAAKGLEFDVIYIGGADESIFPSSKAVEQDGDQEERRLMYVAITRGKRQVSMTTRDSAIIRGEKKDLAPSRFIAEIAEPYKTYGRPPNARQLAQRAAERERALQGSDSTSPFPGARDQEMWGGGSDQEVRRGAKQQPRR